MAAPMNPATDVVMSDELVAVREALAVDSALAELRHTDAALAVVLTYLVDRVRDAEALAGQATQMMANPSTLMKLMGLGGF